MTPLAVFAACAILAAYAASFARAEWARTASYVLLVASLCVTCWLASGLPRPIFFTGPAGTVLAYRLDEPRAIYLWLGRSGDAEPIAYRIPWDHGEAAQLVEASNEAHAHGTKLKAAAQSAGGEQGQVDRPGAVRFYAEPVKPLPPKARK